MMLINEVAKLAKVSVRTLHHYDRIGLFRPGKISPAGYRLYTEEDLDRLQQILFFKELDFPLQEIKEIMGNPGYNRIEALRKQKELLNKRRNRIDQILATLEKTLQHEKGEIIMTREDKFEGFDFSRNPYEKEARQRWGEQAVEEANAKMAALSPDEKKNLEDEINGIYKSLAGLRHSSPASWEAQEAIGEWYAFLGTFGNYSPDAFIGLGQMYVQDERFTRNIDKFGEGLAQFMCDAMAVYGENLKR